MFPSKDVKGLDFWLHDMPIVERKARQNIEGNYSNNKGKLFTNI